jgi:hypothetical protein
LVDRIAKSAEIARSAMVVPELPLGALRAVEDELVVRVEIGAPALLIGGQPAVAALGALWDQSDLFGAHCRGPE